MKSWPNTDGAAIDEFVRERRLRLQGTRARYARVLGGFQDFVVRRGVPPRTSAASYRWSVAEAAGDNPFAKPPAVLGRLKAVERILE